MNSSGPCELCYKIQIYTKHGGTVKDKFTMNYIGLNGTLTYYADGFKRYLKQCCLMSYYVGYDRLHNTLVKQTFGSIVKPKAPKYVVTETESFAVYEINYNENETIKDPEAFDNKTKLEITRRMILQEHDIKYSIYTHGRYKQRLNQIKSTSKKTN